VVEIAQNSDANCPNTNAVFKTPVFKKKNRVGANSDFEPGANFPEGVKICLKTPLSSVALMLSRPVMIVLELAKLAN
jgi:hypothetical protein